MNDQYYKALQDSQRHKKSNWQPNDDSLTVQWYVTNISLDFTIG